jgi:hypothetical protein
MAGKLQRRGAETAVAQFARTAFTVSHTVAPASSNGRTMIGLKSGESISRTQGQGG